MPINIAYLYAAKDAQITYELYEWQLNEYNKPGNEKLKELLQTIEIPLVPVVAEMQRYGIGIDLDRAKELSAKYHKILEEAEATVDDVCNMYRKEIAEYNRKNPRSNFKLPLNPNSSQQVAKLLYDVLGITSPDKHNPRGTGKEILQKIDEPVCQAILDYKSTDKLLGTYIDKLPKCLNPKTGKIHASFNQNGTETGRFSSSA